MFRFLIRAAIFYTIWQVIYDLFLLPNGKIDEFLSLSVVYISKTILNIFGWDINSLGRIITINGYRGVEVLNECNALTLMVLYSGFIICFKGSLQNKVKFVTVGILFIYWFFSFGNTCPCGSNKKKTLHHLCKTWGELIAFT